MRNKPNIILDTNILLVSIFETSPFFWVLDSLDKGKFNLFLSTDILIEYDEVISRKTSPSISHKTLSYLLSLNNVLPINIYYYWNLLKDESDNKFADCAIAANADFLVTNDKHFNVLKDLDFPKVRILSLSEFEKLLKPLDN
jgi:uncharacterized protein